MIFFFDAEILSAVIFLKSASISITVAAVSSFIYYDARRMMQAAVETVEASSRLVNVDSMNPQGIRDLMLNSIKRLERYYDWNISEARIIFWTAISFSGVGFVLFFAAVYTAYTRNNLDATIPAAVGGAIAELLAHTVLNMYRTSVEQLNHYHQALHADQRFLANVGVVERLSTDDRRDELYRDIIHIEMNAAVMENNAQAVDNMSGEVSPHDTQSVKESK